MAPRPRRWAGGSASGLLSSHDGTCPRFHVRFPIALVGAYRSRRSVVDAGTVRQRTGSFQLTKDSVFVLKKVANESIGMLLLHSHRGLYSRPKNAWCQGLSESRDVRFIGGSELN
jgi:hypothetical protein